MFKRKKGIDIQKAKAKARAAFEKAGRMADKATGPFQKAYLNEKHVRVRVLITNEESEVLLVRSWFGHQKWSLPGGGIQSVERPAEAAAREVHEETGIRIAVEDLQELGTFNNPDPKKPFNIVCFKVVVPKREPHLAKHRRLEMLDVAWFPANNLPPDHSATVNIALSLLK